MKSYITTAIDFPNGPPHMGHVMEKVLADVYARWCRLRGDEVRFQIGTDDHGIKIQRTAAKQNLTPNELVLNAIPKFETLFDNLHISYDQFMSTSQTPGHYETAQALWLALEKGGYLYQKEYKGLYCAGCEEFKTQRDLVDGLCINHQVAPEEIIESNWFFKLTDFQDYLRTLLTSKEYEVVPEYRAKEIFAFLDEGFSDVSFSRPKTTLFWGVPVPNDEDQVMYVWCDNLTNYISTLGMLTSNAQIEWWNDAEVTHVIGKDITRFHGLNWPAMLHAVGLKVPDRLLVHGFLTSNGQKMSKSLGNVVVPSEILARVGNNPDPLRFYLSHEVPVGRDGDFNYERFDELYNSALRNTLGNLLNRVLVMLAKEGGALVHTDSYAQTPVADLWQTYQNDMNAFMFKEALETVMDYVREGNALMEQHKPWQMEQSAKIEFLSSLCESLRHIALLLLPFVPTTSQKITQQLGVEYAGTMLKKEFVLTEEMRTWNGVKTWATVSDPSILFAPLDSFNQE